MIVYINIVIAIFFSSCLHANTTYTKKLFEYKPELFALEAVPTEVAAYELLKEKPIESTTYVAVPWAYFLNKKTAHTIDLEHTFTNAFTICQHIWYKNIIPILRKHNITTLFCTHAMHAEQFDGITILPFPHYATCQVDAKNTQKDLLYSCIAAPYHPTRRAFFKKKHPKKTIVKKRKTWHYFLSSHIQKKHKQEYADALKRSRFAICIRGTGPGIVRFWEALCAGAIPVLVSDNLMLPAETDWDSCIIRVAEKNVTQIPTILAAITPEQERMMRKRCLEIYKQYSGTHFVRTIRTYYAIQYKSF